MQKTPDSLGGGVLSSTLLHVHLWVYHFSIAYQWSMCCFLEEDIRE